MEQAHLEGARGRGGGRVTQFAREEGLLGDWGEVGLLGDLRRVSTALAWLCGHALGRYASSTKPSFVLEKKEDGAGFGNRVIEYIPWSREITPTPPHCPHACSGHSISHS